MITLLRWIVRVAGLGALAIGAIPARVALINVHMALGGLVALALIVLGVMAFITRAKSPAAVAGFLVGLGLVSVGMMQLPWLGQGGHLVVRVCHVLLGIMAIGLGEALAAAITRKRASLA
ncbi:MAG TPA: hypothetical protein VHZ74_02745 [Bryobacteraceae bacterium]|jgi:hypothetical protein|nr:hypothetical protein [Bryobacteraceae bacterium]